MDKLELEKRVMLLEALVNDMANLLYDTLPSAYAEDLSNLIIDHANILDAL